MKDGVIEFDRVDQEANPEVAQRELKEPSQDHEDDSFPSPMSKEAFHGIAGEIVGIIEPESEASKEALLAHFLVAFGNLIGRNAVRYQAAPHYLNEFVNIVGDTASARKGTGWRAVNPILKAVDEAWMKCVVSGIQSGEAIVSLIRDELKGVPPVDRRKKGEADVIAEVVLDPGVDDKRLLLLEEELARIFGAATSNGGKTLSPTLRTAFDSPEVLRVAGKHSPQMATEPHVSVIGHITREELRKVMATVEHENGMGNRFLWIASRRSKIIPIPGWIDWVAQYSTIIERLKSIVSTFSIQRTLRFSEDGEKHWCDFYNANQLPPGIHGKLGKNFRVIAGAQTHQRLLRQGRGTIVAISLLTKISLSAANRMPADNVIEHLDL